MWERESEWKRERRVRESEREWERVRESEREWERVRESERESERGWKRNVEKWSEEGEKERENVKTIVINRES